MTSATAAAAGTPVFTAAAPFEERQSETLVIYCADGRFRPAVHEFTTQHLKLDRPVTITVPGGVSIFMPFVGLVHKLVKKWLDVFSAEMRRIIIIAHEDCAAYKSQNTILEAIVTRVTGHPVRELQREHLNRAIAQLRIWYPKAKVEAYYADVVEGSDGTKRVEFTAIQ